MLVVYFYMVVHHVVDAGFTTVPSCGDCANAGDSVGVIHHGVRRTVLWRFWNIQQTAIGHVWRRGLCPVVGHILPHSRRRPWYITVEHKPALECIASILELHADAIHKLKCSRRCMPDCILLMRVVNNLSLMVYCRSSCSGRTPEGCRIWQRRGRRIWQSCLYTQQWQEQQQHTTQQVRRDPCLSCS